MTAIQVALMKRITAGGTSAFGGGAAASGGASGGGLGSALSSIAANTISNVAEDAGAAAVQSVASALS
jgi:hypothetical protein